MCNFESLVQGVESLRSICFDNLNSSEIREISVDVPTPPFDELYFRKAVSWCYIFFNETGPFIRFSEKILRTNPSASDIFRKLRYFVECARTVHSHNLSDQRQEDVRKRRTYEIWILEKGGDPVDWQRCCKALIVDFEHLIGLVREAYVRRNLDAGDQKDLWDNYKLEKATHWEAHEFDEFVERAAVKANINGLDSTLFRKEGSRVERWRRLVAMFQSREASENALERAVFAEVVQVFGGGN